MHRYASKYGISLEECPQSCTFRTISVKRSVKNDVFSRQDIYNKIFILLRVSPSVCDKKSRSQSSVLKQLNLANYTWNVSKRSK